MRNKRFLTWLTIFLSVLLVGVGIGLYIIASVIEGNAPEIMGRPATTIDYLFALFGGQSKHLLKDVPGEIITGYYVMAISGILASVWAIYGVWKLRARRWGYWLFVMIVSGLFARLLTQIFESYELDTLAFTIIRFWFLFSAFIFGLWLIQVMLFGRNPIIAIARASVMEITRMRVAIVFVLALFIFLPLLRYSVLGEARLAYQIQSFIYASMMTCGIMLCLMTVFVSCQTVCDELYYKQIFLTMSKPVSRMQYLLGKWLGVSLLNAVLVSVACGGTYIMTQSLATTVAYSSVDFSDYESVMNEVMVARESSVPFEKERDPYEFQQNVDALALKIASEKYVGVENATVTEEERMEATGILLSELLVIPSLSKKEFYFRELEIPSKDSMPLPLQLFIKPQDDAGYPEVTIEIKANGYTIAKRRQFKSNVLQVIDIPGYLVDLQGNLAVEINNLSGFKSGYGSAMRFEPGEGLNLYRKVGSFGPNLSRGFVILWFELIFLAILGISLGGAMSFPVACLSSMFVFVIAYSSNYLIETMDVEEGVKAAAYWKVAMGLLSEGKYYDGALRLFKILGGFIVSWMPKFGQYDPSSALSQGKLVSIDLVVYAGLNIVLLWSVITGFIGWLIFRARELARVVF